METEELTQFMGETKRDIEYILKKVDKVPTNEEVKLSIKLSNRELIEEMLSQADKRYASKGFENLVYTLVVCVILYVLNSFLELI